MSVFLDPIINLERVASLLDGLGHEGRVHTIRHWGPKLQARLFEAAKGFRQLSLEHFVPASVGEKTEVIHEGQNTLPLFNHFQKRFCKLADGTLAGYNHGSTGWATGPGYFSVKADVAGVPEGELDIDYRTLPTEKVGTWPEILPNKAKLGFLVYEGMIDHMRGISEHVSIGRAQKGAKPMNAWFALVRKDP